MTIPYRRQAVGAAALVLAAACATHDQSVSTAHATAMRDSVQTMLNTFRRYSASRQWDSLATLYVADSTLRFIENGELRLRSAAVLKKYYGALPPTTSIETTYDTLEITPVAPGVASVLTWYHTTIKDSTRGNFTFGGLLTMTLVHQSGGWRIQNGHTSSPPR